MMRRFSRSHVHDTYRVASGISSSCLLMTTSKRHGCNRNWWYDTFKSTGMVDLPKRAEITDFEYKSPEKQVLPGAHPLPLNNEQMERMPWPLVSPYMPSPRRVHPYWTEAPKEWPHFECNVPIVYLHGAIEEKIVVPVHTIGKKSDDAIVSAGGKKTLSSSSSSSVFADAGEILYTRELDPFVFGQYPVPEIMNEYHTYWQVRTQNYASSWDFDELEIFRKSKKNWRNTGTGMGRVNDRKKSEYTWGGNPRASKPWNKLMPIVNPRKWLLANRMMVTLKMLQGKLQIVDKLELPEPSTEAFLDLCERMQWDIRHTGGGVLFMDGGSRLAPALNFCPSFFYGSFYNGRCKVVRPTLMTDEPIQLTGKHRMHPKMLAPRGQKNPPPINRFNCYDAMEHHLLVITEGALLQLEQESHAVKLEETPPHIREQMAEMATLSSPLLGDCNMPLMPVELEAAARMEEVEKAMYSGYYDDPYAPWPDEHEAGYEVDATQGFVKRHTPNRPGGWKMLE